MEIDVIYMINNRLEELREEKDLKQINVAKFLNVAKSTYSEWEHNKSPIPTKRIIELANFYQVNIDYMLNLSKYKKVIKEKTNINLKDIGLKIKNIRLSLNLTQDELANKLNIAQTTLSNFEIGISLIKIDPLIGLSKLTNYSIDYILNRSKEKNIK